MCQIANNEAGGGETNFNFGVEDLSCYYCLGKGSRVALASLKNHQAFANNPGGLVKNQLQCSIVLRTDSAIEAMAPPFQPKNIDIRFC